MAKNLSNIILMFINFIILCIFCPIYDMSFCTYFLYTNHSKAVGQNKAKGKVGITLTEYDRKVQVAIKDNGIGISKEDLPHIFRRTYRADMSRNSAGGSGLGLSICKKIIEEHGGEIWAESKLRAGTTIFFTLNKVIDQSKEK